jgi:hypothetical protein
VFNHDDLDPLAQVARCLRTQGLLHTWGHFGPK